MNDAQRETIRRHREALIRGLYADRWPEFMRLARLVQIGRLGIEPGHTMFTFSAN